jgi:ribose transport system ATP-binding protein
MTDHPVLLDIDNVSKSFPGVLALDRVTFRVAGGEVHGLVGENGAGKSTLMGIASGAIRPDHGTVSIGGTRLLPDPEHARELGLAIVRQEPAVMPDLTVGQNIYLGVPAGVRPSVARINEWAANLLRLWSDTSPLQPTDIVGRLSPEQRFIVEIVKALAAEPKVLVLDEPTEHLDKANIERLFRCIDQAVGRGAAVVYISHRILEVRQVSNIITVLRDGAAQGTYPVDEVDEQRIVELIVGRELTREFPPKTKEQPDRPAVLEVENFAGSGFTGISLTVARGEIVGLAGIDGAGQREFLRGLAGLIAGRGTVRVNGSRVSVATSDAAARAGIRYLPGDRHREGLLAELSVRENFSLRSLRLDAPFGWIDGQSESQRAREAVANMAVKTPTLETPIQSLSGGNQQKLVLASVLASKPAVLLVDEPTQGVDVGARLEIYQTLRKVADQGTAIVVVSSDAAELAGMCDRVVVISRGHAVYEARGDEVVEGRITSAILTASTVRGHQKRTISRFWNWAAGNTAPLVMVAAAIFLTGLYASHASEFYLSPRNLGGTLWLVATLALVAYGQQIALLVGGIDLSVGPLMGLLLVTASFFFTSSNSPFDFALGIAALFAVAVATGIVNWLFIVSVRLHPMIATLATFMIIQALSLMLRPSPAGLIDIGFMSALGTRVSFVPIAMIVVVILAVILEFLLHRSRIGIILRGLGSRPQAARVAGIRPNLALLVTYVGSAIFAAFAAITMIAQVGIGDARSGVSYTLSSIAAVVIGGGSLLGGRGSFIGALLGALLIYQVYVLATFLQVGDAWQYFLLGGLILASVTLYSKSRQLAEAR